MYVVVLSFFKFVVFQFLVLSFYSKNFTKIRAGIFEWLIFQTF